MTSIESTGFPLVYKVSDAVGRSDGETVVVDTKVRSLEGMQKEALVTSEPGGASWRLACDEGPYLNGKDLAPFPLGFFGAGMQFCFLSGFLRAANAMGVSLDDVGLEGDNYYTMEGSFLRGDAVGGAQSAELKLRVASRAEPARIAQLARIAEASSPIQSLMKTALHNSFSLTLRGRRVDLPGLGSSPSPADEDPRRVFESLAPGSSSFLPDIITRVKKSDAVHGVEGGAGSSLKAEQKRTLHVHSEARPLDRTLMETVVHLYKPIGSSFRFLCDEIEANGGHGRAPSPLVYASAGIGFCYMTQIGRYATIAKHLLDGYRITQRNEFSYEGSVEYGSRRASTGPVDTQVFLDARDIDESTASDLVDVGQRTCFLHAAMRGEHPSVVDVELNGEPIG